MSTHSLYEPVGYSNGCSKASVCHSSECMISDFPLPFNPIAILKKGEIYMIFSTVNNTQSGAHVLHRKKRETQRIISYREKSERLKRGWSSSAQKRHSMCFLHSEGLARATLKEEKKKHRRVESVSFFIGDAAAQSLKCVERSAAAKIQMILKFSIGPTRIPSTRHPMAVIWICKIRMECVRLHTAQR